MPDENPAEAVQPSRLPPAQPPLQPPPDWAPAPPPVPAASVWSRVAAYVVLIAVVAAGAGAGIGWSLARSINSHQVAQAGPASPITPVSPGRGGSSNNNSAAAIAASVSPAIVDVNTTVGSSQAAGSGMIVSSDGEILTNNHVVSGSTSITVTVQGRPHTYTAHVVGVDVS